MIRRRDVVAGLAGTLALGARPVRAAAWPARPISVVVPYPPGGSTDITARIAGERLEVDAAARRWRCFDAERDGRRLRVCERIVDADGQAFTDPSSWFWAALLGRSAGPWRAVTTARLI